VAFTFLEGIDEKKEMLFSDGFRLTTCRNDRDRGH